MLQNKPKQQPTRFRADRIAAKLVKKISDTHQDYALVNMPFGFTSMSPRAFELMVQIGVATNDMLVGVYGKDSQAEDIIDDLKAMPKESRSTHLFDGSRQEALEHLILRGPDTAYGVSCALQIQQDSARELLKKMIGEGLVEEHGSVPIYINGTFKATAKVYRAANFGEGIARG